MIIKQLIRRTRTSLNRRYARLLLPITAVTLNACVYGPLPEGAVARLYHWPDRGNALAERAAVPIGADHGIHLFADLLSEVPQLRESPERSYLLESCLNEICYSAVVFPSHFSLSNKGEVLGTVYLTSISTAIAADTADLGLEEVASRVETLSRLVLKEGAEAGSYTDLLGLDLHGDAQQADLLLNPALLQKADQAIAIGAKPRLSELLQDSGVQTSELVASETFLFSNSWDLVIDVDVSERRSGKLYLTVCGDYQPGAGSFAVDYSNCQLKTALHNGTYSGSLRMTGLVDRLLVTLVPLSDPQQVEYIEWQRERDGERLTIR